MTRSASLWTLGAGITIGALAMAFTGGQFTFDMAALGAKHYSAWLQTLLYIGFLISFGVKLSVFPFHTWLPDAHGEANAPVRCCWPASC